MSDALQVMLSALRRMETHVAKLIVELEEMPR